MKIELISPNVEDAWFWHQVRSQETTQRFNAMGILELDRLKAQIAESNRDISAKQPTHRYFIKVSGVEFAGVIAIRDIDWESGVCDLGYLIAEKYHNQGIATRAVTLILEKAFEQGKLRKVKAMTAVSNVASYRVLQKNGFAFEGSLREELLIAGRPQDAYLWGLTSDDFRTGNRLDIWRKFAFFITTDKKQLQLRRIHRFLSQEAYWCLGIPSSVVAKSIENSICFGLYHQDEKIIHQIGYARLVTDRSTFAWLCDVYIEQPYRGRGLSKWLMECIMSSRYVRGLRRICLATRDAHGLYQNYGFKVTDTPANWMEIKDYDVYRKLNAQPLDANPQP
jgi:RimJ/RimL family protein N-acetyltransferase/N-acetylglutamate synthase-like GNAT family acetyltransferase